MKISTHELSFNGGLLQRGFWLYVWRVETRTGECLYVGRTGDTSSPHATAPYQRMGQHLGNQKTQNMLRQNLEKNGITPEKCIAYHLISYGPIFPEASDMASHRPLRDKIAALEKKLADVLSESGYNVLNEVNCNKKLDLELWQQVLNAFLPHFPMLKKTNE